MTMENGGQRFRSRKRYCCFYCNTYFYQVDAWQRHNRKHTGVEIECDDCGEMFSDHIDLKSHQPNCQAHHVYSEDVYTDNLQKVGLKEHETPDSTSKQEVNNSEDSKNVTENANLATDENDTTEFDDLIGEVEEAKDATAASEEVDPDTEALIGIDHSVQLPVDDNNNENEKCTEDHFKGDRSTTLGDSTSSKQSLEERTLDGIPQNESHDDQVSPSGSSGTENLHSMSLEHAADINKKYQPYFCKNCGARFTRKDSVTRHLKKGTCSGKTAIVCNVCGKIFPDVLELQRHFKLEHKNIAFTPPIITRPILPRPTETLENTRYPSSYPYLAENTQTSRPYVSSHDQHYHQMPPSLQSMFYGNQTHRPSSYHSNRDPYYSNKYIKNMRAPMNTPCKKDPMYMDLHRKSDMNHYKDDIRLPLKREYDYHENDERYYRKSMKNDIEHSPQCRRSDDSFYTKNINLSEYTNNAMSSKQYYDNRFSSKGHSHRSQIPVSMSKEESHAHKCKVCGLEFPRFEYLLTHLRKHKDIDRTTECEEMKGCIKEDTFSEQSHAASYPAGQLHQNNGHHSYAANNDSSSNSSTEESENKQQFVNPSTYPKEGGQSAGNLPVASSSQNNTNGSEVYTSHQEQLNMLTQQQVKPNQENYNGNIGNAFDGKFRPFICENCGQRFTRKDSLVRHAKKQTCYEELVDLKCKHCDKSFRYSKCLTQHQELVHGIPPPVNDKQVGSEDEDSLSDKSDAPQPNSIPQKPVQNKLMSEYEPSKDLPPQVNKHEKPTFVYPVEHMRNNRMPAYNNEDFPVHRNSFYTPHHNIHHQPIKAMNSFIQPSRTNQQSMPKFIAPKDFKSEKSRAAENNTQDSSYIGYSMLQPRPFQCEYCGDRFAHRHSLKRHVRRHLGIGIPCHDCGKLYRDQSEWRRHQLNIHNRRYEKYEVPSRMSFRDGLDQGLIGVLPPVTNGAHQHERTEETDSDRSEEDNPAAATNNTSNKHSQSNLNSTIVISNNAQIPSTNVVSHSEHLKNSESLEPRKDEEKFDDKDGKLKLFDFKSQVHDKDSRKSVLDSYLCSADEEAEAAVKTHI